MILLGPAAQKDLERIFEITLLSFGPYCAAQAIKERYGIGGGVRDKAAATRRSFEKNLERVLVAETDGQVVGYCSSIPCAEFDTWQVGANAVDPAWQGRGIGTRLVSASVREMIEAKGCEILLVSTLEHDRPARRVYGKVGFEEVHRQVSYSAWKHALKPQREAGTAPGLVLRKAGKEDAERLGAIFSAAGDHTPCLEKSMEERFGVRGGKTWRQRRAEQMASLLDGDRTEVFAAECDGRIAGWGACDHGPGAEFGRLTFPCVDPGCREPGVRSALLAHLMGRLDRIDAVRIVDVGVAAADEEAIGICRKVGFEEFSTGVSFAMESREAIYG